MQGEEEEAAPEKPAKKPVREEDVFAGNKNLRSEDVKFREMHDDRCGAPAPAALPLHGLLSLTQGHSLHGDEERLT